MKRYIIAAAASILLMWQCSLDVEPLKHTAPVVEYGTAEENISAKVGTPLTFTAEVKSGDRLTKGWYIDGVLESSSDRLTYTFASPGVYTVTYKATNGAGTAEKSYTVTVSDIFEMHLSVGDSTEIVRVELSTLKLYAIVDNGSDVEHSWSVDGVKMGDKAFFGTYYIANTDSHEISYEGHNAAGSYSKTFTLKVDERPLTVSFSETASTISCKKDEQLKIQATILFGGTGAAHKWYVDGVLAGETASFAYNLTTAGTYTISYLCVNAKGEKVEKSWTVNVAARDEAVFEDFESGSYTCFKQGTLAVVDNPHKNDVNSTSKVLKASAPGTGSTSGYFTMIFSELAKKIPNYKEYKGLMVYVWMDKGEYYPVMDYGGTKHLSNELPVFNGEWQILEYDFDFGTIDTSKSFQPRPFQVLNSSGKPTNIPAGAATEKNPRVMYFDNFTLYK